MKNIVTSALVGAMILAAAKALVAQPFTSQDFLATQAVYATNALNITNLTLNANGTNLAGTTYTNATGTRIVVAGTTGASANLLKDAVLWADRDGRWYSPTFTNSLAATEYYAPSPFNISVAMTGGSGANAAVTFVFAPIWDEEDAGAFVGSHDSAETFTFSFTATTTTELSRSTNVPVWKWPGARGLRCLRIVNADVDATSQVIVNKLKLNSYRP